MHTNYQWLSIGFVLLVFILPMDALGASNEESIRIDSSIGWKISNFFDDLRVNYFISDPEEKALAIAEQGQKAQLVIEVLSAEGKPVPNDLVERVEERRLKAEEVLVELEQKRLEDPGEFEKKSDEGLVAVNNCLLPPCSETTREILDDLKDVKEANELRLLVNDFNKLRDDSKTGRLNSVQIETEANRIDSHINNLDIVGEHCNERIDSLSLTFVDSPYKELQNNCPILQHHSLEDAQNRLRVLGSDID